jgi:hypothetical protein
MEPLDTQEDALTIQEESEEGGLTINSKRDSQYGQKRSSAVYSKNAYETPYKSFGKDVYNRFNPSSSNIANPF